VLSCRPATRPGPPRVAYAIGRRAGGAVERNRIRRRLRHVVRDHAARLRRDHEYLLGAGPAALQASPAELTDAWLRLVDRVHVDLDGATR
jgi:ribonuclease P protein component